MKPVKTRAIVLRRTNYQEADRILQIITPDGTKMGVMARGVRKEKSKLASGIELFSISEMVLQQGKGDLSILTSARLEVFYEDILKDYDRLHFGYEAVKYIGKVAEHVTEPHLFTILKTTLASLNEYAIDFRITKAWFYIHIADVLGHGLNLSRDHANRSLSAEKKYRFDIAEMTFTESSTGNFTANHLKLLKIIKLKDPPMIAHISGIENYLDDCLSLAHAVSD